ncbi:helix-turn-helix domain-containing protein [Sporosarcina beigongshangi]|uniref:helix-turn-helix domain-containing protein n=1 Tax=Sporosarcina beigongshangi TaxID=2782538 RepID=UPI0019395DE9|nr:AraC family transcriptional regulator [Sporosarcina beigongshangi]
MNQLDIFSAAFKIHHLTNLNTYILDQNGEFIFHHETISIPVFMPGSKDEDIFNFYKKMTQNDQLYIFTNHWGLHYIGYSFSLESDYNIIIGPYLQLTPNLHHLTKTYQLNHDDSEDLTIFCNQVQLVGMEKALSFSSLLQLFNVIVENDVLPKQIEQNKEHAETNNSNQQYNIIEDVGKVVDLRYKIEADFLHAVEQGDKAKALELFGPDNLLFSFSERFPNQPLRRLKNLVIVINTLLRTVAVKKKVPPILIHRTSEKFAVQIENKTRLVELRQLQNEMIEEYCELVISNSFVHYSKIIQEVIAYIMTYYNKRIDINELASLNFTHPSHLSRKFKQETNLTITAYQQQIRMHEAKHLLKNENLPIEEIAWRVGYEDSSYFARVFKQETGHTPSQFRII